MANNEQISKSQKIIKNIKEEKVINKSKNGSKKSINSSNNNDENKSHKGTNITKKSVNINLNNKKKVDINDKK